MEAFEKNLRMGKILYKKLEADEDVLITVKVRKSLRDKANRKARKSAINLSEFIRNCLEAFCQSPIDRQVSKVCQSVTEDAIENSGD